MKPYLPVAIVAVLVLAGLAAAFLLTPALAPPQARLQTQIADQVAQAEAMLAAYSPVDAALLQRFDATLTSQPAETNPDLRNDMERLRGAMQRREKLIDDALATIQDAIRQRIDAGDQSVGGEANAAATRLEAMLLAEKAQLLRRQAALHWRRAARARDHVGDALVHWNDVNTQYGSLLKTLRGEGVLRESAVAPAAAPETPEAEPGPGAEPAPAASPPPGGHSRLGSLLGSLLRSRRTAPPAAAPVATPAVEPPATEPQTAITQAPPAERPSAVALPPACTLGASLEELLARQTQSPTQRIADLQLCRQEVEKRIQQAQASADALTPQVQQLRQQIDTAKGQADAARKKMLDLENEGVDATDPNSLPDFTQQYRDASTTYRRALRTVSMLTGGAVEQPQMKPEDRELLTEPPIAVEGVQGEQRGLSALEGDLSALQGAIESNKRLIEQIDKEIARLSGVHDELDQYVKRLDGSRTQLKSTLDAALAQVTAEAVKAYELEEQSLAAAESGRQAAEQRALRAAEARVNQAKTALGEYPENERYQKESNDRTAIGHAKSLRADMDAAAAMTQAQRYLELSEYAQMLNRYRDATAGPSAASIPGGEPPASMPSAVEPPAGAETAGEKDTKSLAWTTDPTAATAAAETARTQAIEMAKAAKGSPESNSGYTAAANDLKLWTLNTEVAAMDYLLSTLTTGEESDKYLADARRQYELATRDRRDRPEVQALTAVYGRLGQPTTRPQR